MIITKVKIENFKSSFSEKNKLLTKLVKNIMEKLNN